MKSKFGTGVLVVGVLFCLFTTFKSGWTPVAFASDLGLRIENTGGFNEVRAQYAGFFLVIAAVCAASLLGALSRRIAFVLLGAQFGGLFLGRLASLAVNRGFDGYSATIRALYVIDGLGLILAITALVLDQRASSRS